ncbi:hypothetical protein DMN91_002112 [Ooceraea biroi]|uniref:Uncharacterized protein n=1 Tax=Ooceraea biroi TaxID=2015173 RepID=A0A3L8E181_OOCBI|nr:uncharacterized protein LOC105284427 [Ooceraea biroi]RLU25949.1 hypothetical protein DMN91_002112 [Ooceraea biroi]
MTSYVVAPQLLASAMVNVRDRGQQLVKCRALLDTCSTANFISESCVKRLKLTVAMQSLPVGSINALNTISKGVVQITLQSVHDNFSKTLTCLTMPTIADLIPTEIFPRGSINIPANLRLADPEFHLPRPVDLLIGAGVTVSLFSIGQIHLPLERGDLYLQKTRLGWIVVGDPLAQRQPASITCHFTKLEGQLERFWAIEEVNADVPRSREDSECETHFVENVHREDSGRYVVRLPFRNRGERLGESRSVALKRLVSLERRLNADAMLRVEYDRVIKEYLELGHMSLAESIDDDGWLLHAASSGVERCE